MVRRAAVLDRADPGHRGDSRGGGRDRDGAVRHRGDRRCPGRSIHRSRLDVALDPAHERVRRPLGTLHGGRVRADRATPHASLRHAAEALAEVAATIRNHGAQHPDAVFHGRHVTPKDVLDSRLSPSRSTCSTARSTPRAGAGLVLTSADRAARPGQHARSSCSVRGTVERQGMAYVTAPVWDRYGLSGR